MSSFLKSMLLLPIEIRKILFFFITVVWVTMFDTVYALLDKKFDEKININSYHSLVLKNKYQYTTLSKKYISETYKQVSIFFALSFDFI